MRIVFAAQSSDHQGEWQHDSSLKLFQQGIVKGFDISFIPVEGRRPTCLDYETFGKSTNYIYTKWKLMKCSIVMDNEKGSAS